MAPKSADTQDSDPKVSATAGVHWFMTPDSVPGSSPPTSSAEPEATVTDSAAESSRPSSSAESGGNKTNQDNGAHQESGADQQNRADQDNDSENDKPRLTDREKKTNHISSEQKRRASIRGGFDRLTELVPGIRGQARSEAVVLAKTVEFAREQILERLSLIRQTEARGGTVPDRFKDAIVDYESKQAELQMEGEEEEGGEQDKEPQGAPKNVEKGAGMTEAEGEARREGEAEEDGHDEQETGKEAEADKARGGEVANKSP
ncbi:MAG: hypothetical protein M1815_000803 [Lichina confinis]|nr:MAG: hypothetical protein M1815_000803 [Lichina confinis]